MASEDKEYTAAFKKEVAQKALDQSKQNLDKLSEKYDVPVSVILMWATELEKGGKEAFETPKEEQSTEEVPEQKAEEVEVEITNDKIASSVEHGVMDDKLNYKRLVFWTAFGVLLVIIFVKSLTEMFQYNEQLTQERVSSQSEYYQVNQLKREADKELNSFGVVNLDKGIYRIPIDSAISDIAKEE